jgi:hypothetical protein
MRVIVMRAGQPELALDTDRCVEILSECEFVLTGPTLLLDFLRVPDGLNAAQLERHLREHALEICGERHPGTLPGGAPGSAVGAANHLK